MLHQTLITNEELKMAERYKLYLSGFAYIPYQDLAKYEKAYEKSIRF